MVSGGTWKAITILGREDKGPEGQEFDILENRKKSSLAVAHRAGQNSMT